MHPEYMNQMPRDSHLEETSLNTYLLRQFVQKGSEAAFAEIVRRHSRLVYATCLREVNDAALAEEAGQVVFLLLARKAASLQRLPSLSGWLFRTARFVSRNALRQERRRRVREQKAAEMAQTQHETTQTAWNEFAPLLNEALSALSPKEQEVILLHYFEEMSWREAAQTLAISEDAAQKRCTRALSKLRRIVGGAGLVLTAAALTELLSERAADAAPLPPALASKIAGPPSLHVIQIYHGVTHTMMLTKTAAVLGGLALTLTAGSLLWAEQPHAPTSRLLAPHVLQAAAPAQDTDEAARKMLAQAQAHYHSLSSFSMKIVQHDSSGLYAGHYTQQLDWKRGTMTDGNGGKFSLRNLSPSNKALPENFGNTPHAVPDFFANGSQVVAVEPSGKKTTEWEASRPNFMPGWEVTGGFILSWLQKTPIGNIASNPPPGMKIVWSIGPRTVWQGLKVREVCGQITHEGQPGTSMGSFFLSASSPKFVGQEAPTGGPGSKIGYALYTDQQENPVLPATLGDAP